MAVDVQPKSSSIGTIVFMVGAVLFAALGGVLLAQLLSQNYPQEPVEKLVVAARDIPAGTQLDKNMLRLAAWPRSSVPKGAQRSIAKLVASKAVPLVPIVAGSALLRGHVSAPQSGFGVAAKLEPGERAVAIRTEDGVTLAQLVYPGAKVDIVTTMRRPGSLRAGEVVSRILLQNIKVLAVGPRIDGASAAQGKLAEGVQARDREKAAQRIVTLALLPEQAERLVLAKREGKLDLILRSPKDHEVITTSGVSPEDLVGRVAAEPGVRTPPPPPLPPITQPRAAEPAAPRARPSRRRPRRVRRARPAPVRVVTPTGPRVIRGTD